MSTTVQLSNNNISLNDVSTDDEENSSISQYPCRPKPTENPHQLIEQHSTSKLLLKKNSNLNHHNNLNNLHHLNLNSNFNRGLNETQNAYSIHHRSASTQLMEALTIIAKQHKQRLKTTTEEEEEADDILEEEDDDSCHETPSNDIGIWVRCCNLFENSVCGVGYVIGLFAKDISTNLLQFVDHTELVQHDDHHSPIFFKTIINSKRYISFRCSITI